MGYKVVVTVEAERDILQIFDYIYRHDSPHSALHVLKKLQDEIASPASLPDRGATPPEFALTGRRSHREVFFKPYRIFYSVRGRTVHVQLVADGRRRLVRLMTRRLAGG